LLDFLPDRHPAGIDQQIQFVEYYSRFFWSGVRPGGILGSPAGSGILPALHQPSAFVMG
jgi:hypothetical protein